MNSAALGERLTQLRLALAAEMHFPAKQSRARVAHVAGVSPAALARLEKTGAGTAATLAAVLACYQEAGVNLAWVLAPDNDDIPMRGYRDVFQDQKLLQAQEPLTRLHRLLPSTMSELNAGRTLAPEALRALLVQVQECILHALTHLVPPRRLVLSEADLREYQRRLPPVRASSDGWRSAALYTVPYHYYEADETLPQCGEPVSYLAYDPGPQEASTSIQCGACKHQLSISPRSVSSLDIPAKAPR